MPLPLAPELLFLIIEHVDDKTDLYSLALCCSAFRGEAQRRLFRDVASTSLDREKQFLSAIKGAPLRLGPLVHSFHVGECESDGAGHAASLSTALQAMRELKHLGLGSWDPSRILHTSVFQLRTFVCNSYLGGQKQVLFLIRKFLPAQRDIKRLEIYYGRDPVHLSKAPKGLCPQLEFLSINNAEIAHVLLADTRLLSEFQWRQFHGNPPLTICQLNYLKSLTLYIRLGQTNTSFMAHLTSLVDLKLHVPITTTDHLLDTVSRSVRPYVPDLMLIIISLTGPLSATYSASSIPYFGPPASKFIDGEREGLRQILSCLPASI